MPHISIANPAIAAGTIKDLVVQLTGSTEDEHRLAVATAVAETFDAHLIGVHLHALPDILDITDPMQSGTIRTLLETSEQEADRTFQGLTARFAQLQVSHELRRLHGFSSDLGLDLASLARSADLFIGTRPYGDPEGQHRIEERVLYEAGRSCLFLPPGGSPHRTFETIAIAWDPSREAARAVAEAMPFLERASKVVVVHVGSPLEESKETDVELSRISAHLRRYGVEAEAITVPFLSSTGEAIEQAAHQQGADLIVMGAYGHRRLVELVFGGATRYILRHATLPVLMAH
jgi:nucleotide-binding universal stress UspA family protein